MRKGFLSEKSRFLITIRDAPDISLKVYSFYSKINEFAVAGARSMTTNLCVNLLRYSLPVPSVRSLGYWAVVILSSSQQSAIDESTERTPVPGEWPIVAGSTGSAHRMFCEQNVAVMYIYIYFFPLFFSYLEVECCLARQENFWR